MHFDTIKCDTCTTLFSHSMVGNVIRSRIKAVLQQRPDHMRLYWDLQRCFVTRLLCRCLSIPHIHTPFWGTLDYTIACKYKCTDEIQSCFKKKKITIFWKLAVVVMNIVIFKLGLDFGPEFETVIHVPDNLWVYFVFIKMVILCMYVCICVKGKVQRFFLNCCCCFVWIFFEVCRSHSCKLLHI